MKDEEMAEEYANNIDYTKTVKIFDYVPYHENCDVADMVAQAFLAGLKAGRPQWHDLEKEPTDLPKDNHNVWCKALDHYGEGWYDKDTNTWTLIYRGYHLHCIEAWCEIPTFNKE